MFKSLVLIFAISMIAAFSISVLCQLFFNIDESDTDKFDMLTVTALFLVIISLLSGVALIITFFYENFIL